MCIYITANRGVYSMWLPIEVNVTEMRTKKKTKGKEIEEMREIERDRERVRKRKKGKKYRNKVDIFN